MTLEDKFTELQALLATQHTATMAALAAQQSSLDTMAINSGLSLAALGFIKADTSGIAGVLSSEATTRAATASYIATLSGSQLPLVIDLLEAIDAKTALPSGNNTQLGDILLAIQGIATDVLYSKITNAEMLARLNTIIITIDYMRDFQLVDLGYLSNLESIDVSATYLSAINAKLQALALIQTNTNSTKLSVDALRLSNEPKLLAIQAAVENSAVSGNGNNSILLAIDGRIGTSNILLGNIADCSCNDGEPTPVSLECDGVYRRATLASGIQSDPTSYCILSQDNIDVYNYVSWLADVKDVNTIGSITYGGVVYSSNRSNLIRVQYLDVWCVENVGTVSIRVLYAVSNNFTPAWDYFDIAPGESAGLSVLIPGDEQVFTVLSAVDKKGNADGFRVNLYYEKAVAP